MTADRVVFRSPVEYRVAALALVDAVGPADPGIGITMRAAAAAASVTRSTIYRHWESVAELNDDLISSVVAQADSWQRRVLDDDDGSIGDAVARAVDGGGLGLLGVAARAVASQWAATDERQHFASAWEADWLDRFEAWMAARLRRSRHDLSPGITTRVVAVASAAVVEGHLMVHLYQNGIDGGDAVGPSGAMIGRAVDRLLADVTTRADAGSAPSPPPDGSPPDLPTTGLPPTKQAILDRIATAIERDPHGEEASPEPGRVVDLGRLARRLDVSERRIYDVWPTAADANLELVEALIEREVALIELHVDEAIDEVLGASSYGDDLFIRGFQSFVEAMVTTDRVHIFAFTLAGLDPMVRKAMSDGIDQHREQVRNMLLAILAVTRRYRVPDLTVADYVGHHFAIALGMARLVGLHRGLLEETVVIGGVDAPLCGVAAWLLSRSMNTAELPGPPG